MANEEHVAMVRRGREAIKEWRSAHPEQLLDLIEAGLTGADLRGANLRRANLREADLRRANLGGADLSGASLIGADLSRANLGRANLGGADLSGASLRETVFADIDLRSVQGLDEVHHWGPSIIDFRTLARSGPLPLPFLRGCGLPERLIEYLPSLLNETILYNSCFISYSANDLTFAERLHADLQNAGVRCWFAPKDLKIGDRYREVFDRAIQRHERTLLILSKDSVKSDWVEKERKQKRTVLFPVRLDDAVMRIETGWAADVRRLRHMGDFLEWQSPEQYKTAFRLLLHDLKAEEVSP